MPNEIAGNPEVLQEGTVCRRPHTAQISCRKSFFSQQANQSLCFSVSQNPAGVLGLLSPRKRPGHT